MLKCVWGVPREGHLRVAVEEGQGILLRDIWQAVLTTKEGEDYTYRRAVGLVMVA